jgi:hypothetical protein
MSPIDAFKKYWVPISSLTVSIAGALTVYSTPPIQFSQLDADGINISTVEKWITATLIALTWLASLKLSKIAQRKTWIRLVALFLPLSIFFLATDTYFTRQWSVQFVPGQSFRVVTGSKLTVEAKSYQATKPCRKNDAVCLLKGFEGDSRAVWDYEVLEERMWIISIARSLAQLTCVITLLSIIMALGAFAKVRRGTPRAKHG